MTARSEREEVSLNEFQDLESYPKMRRSLADIIRATQSQALHQ
jgi:hypothetical protein